MSSNSEVLLPDLLPADSSNSWNHGQSKNSSIITEKEGSLESMFTPSTANNALFILIACVIPVIAMFGIIGNIFSGCVLVRDGLDKSYNVFLLGLACSDSSFLVPLVITGFVGAAGFKYPENKRSFLFVFFKILLVFDYGGALTSMTLPLFITFERLIVVFFPLSLARYTSSKKTFCVVLCIFIAVYTFVLYAVCTEALETTVTYINSTRSGEGMLVLANFRNAIDETPAMQEFGRTLFGPFPVCVVFSGCVLLAIKIKLQSMQRKKMTNSSSGSSAKSRVTLTLLVVCMVYTLTSLELFLLFSGIMDKYYKERDRNGLFFVFMVEFNNMVVVINCSVNFLIYVFINRKFRATFITMMSSGCAK